MMISSALAQVSPLWPRSIQFQCFWPAGTLVGSQKLFVWCVDSHSSMAKCHSHSEMVGHGTLTVPSAWFSTITNPKEGIFYQRTSCHIPLPSKWGLRPFLSSSWESRLPKFQIATHQRLEGQYLWVGTWCRTACHTIRTMLGTAQLAPSLRLWLCTCRWVRTFSFLRTTHTVRVRWALVSHCESDLATDAWYFNMMTIQHQCLESEKMTHENESYQVFNQEHE